MIESKFTPKIKEEVRQYSRNSPESWLIRATGENSVTHSDFMTKELWLKGQDSLRELDIVLLSYLQFSVFFWKYAEKFYGDKYVDYHNPKRANIRTWVFSKYLPYLWDDYGRNIILPSWTEVHSLEVYWFDANNVKHRVELPHYWELFDNIEECLKFVDDKIRELYPGSPSEEGTLLHPWDIEEAKEVLKADGWNEDELEHLQWVGGDRGFSTCYEIDPFLVKTIKDQNFKDVAEFLEGLNRVSTTMQSAGFRGNCGNWIYRIDLKKMFEPNSEDLDEIVKVGEQYYYIHEGD